MRRKPPELAPGIGAYLRTRKSPEDGRCLVGKVGWVMGGGPRKPPVDCSQELRDRLPCILPEREAAGAASPWERRRMFGAQQQPTDNRRAPLQMCSGRPLRISRPRYGHEAIRKRAMAAGHPLQEYSGNPRRPSGFSISKPQSSTRHRLMARYKKLPRKHWQFV